MESHMASKDYLPVSEMTLGAGNFNKHELATKFVNAELWAEELFGDVRHDYVVLTLERPTSQGDKYVRVDFGDKAFAFRTCKTSEEVHAAEKSPKIHTFVTFDTKKCEEERCDCHSLDGLGCFLNEVRAEYNLVDYNCWTMARTIISFVMGGEDGPPLACIPNEEADKAHKKIGRLASGHNLLRVLKKVSSTTGKLAVKSVKTVKGVKSW
eukprot:TRINITY_DN18332_c0_g1_i1.p1 TRINITY_DN18332_c0_g1~~TRINITY_DN18332_c0_g1_i1.p1  ORF type:complete len:210 (-),score=28.01 TRINITY_DN18332_c0_g1_i1:595-1224(-)